MPLNENQINLYYTKKFALNLKYKDFIDLFTKKKKLSDIVRSDELSEYIDCELIEKKFI